MEDKVQSKHHRWAFGDSEVDLEARELRRAGRPVELEPRAFDLLALLLERHGEVVSREEMLEAVWPGRVVADSAFNQAILKVRRAVGDDGNAQRIVRTVARRGYRFVADVRSIDAEGDTPDAAPAKPIRKAQVVVSRRRLAIGGISVLLGLLLLLGVYQVATEPQPRYAVLPVAIGADQPEQWVKLGLMALIDESLTRQAVDTVNPGAVLSVLEQTKTQGANTAQRVAAVTRNYQPVHVIAASAIHDPSGWRLDYSVYENNEQLTANHVRAGTPADLAAALSQALLSKPRPITPLGASLAEELHGRGLAANLEGDARAAAEYFKVALREQPKRPWTRYELALAQRSLGQNDIARATLNELLEVAARTGDTKLGTGVHSALGILEWRGGRLDAAESQLRQALALAEAHEGKTAGLTLNLGILASSRGEFKTADQQYRRALARYRAEEDRGGEAKAYNGLGVLAWKQGEYAESGYMHQRALDIRRELGLRGEAATSVNNLGTVAALRGRWGEAEGFYSEARTLHRELGNDAHYARSTSNLAAIRLWQGRYAESTSLASEAVAVAKRVDYRPAYREACGLTVEVALRRGDAEAAARALEDCKLRESDPASLHMAQGFQRIQLALLRGEPADPQALLASVHAEGDVGSSADAELQAARVAAMRGDEKAREAHLIKALDWAREARHPGLMARSAAALGRIWLQQHRADDVEALLTDAALWPAYAPGVMLSGLYAEARSDLSRARSEMRRAKTLAGEGWSAEFAQALQRVESSISASVLP